MLSTCSKGTVDRNLVEGSNKNQAILLRNVNIFNGRDSSLLLNKDVLLDSGIIKAIATYLKSTKEEVIEIDCRGKTLMPGLIDAHVHLSGSGCVPWEKVPADMVYNLSAYLYAGVTTVYDLGGLASDISNLSKQVETGEVIGPTIYNTHIPITVKNSHPIPLTEEMLPAPLKRLVNIISPTIDKIEDAPQLIKNYLKHDIDYVKIVCDQIPPGSPEMSFEQLKALIDEAHKSDRKVFVHIGSPQNALDAIRAGADVLAHGVWRGRLSPSQADTIAAANIPIIYTLAGFHNVKAIYNGEFTPSKRDQVLVPQNILGPITGEKGKDVYHQKQMNLFFKDVVNQSPNWLYNFQLLHQRGVTILIGTDSNLPGTYAGSTYYQEIQTLKAFGLSNYEILTGATYLNSRIFLSAPDFGLVAEGYKANLLLINGNPLENIELIHEPEMILKEGEIIQKVR